MPHDRLTALVALSALSLLAVAVLGMIVAHGTAPYGFEEPALDLLGRRRVLHTWVRLSDLLAMPVILVVMVLSAVAAAVKGAFERVLVYAAFAAGTFLVSEHVMKPLVQRTYEGEVTFPSGSVTAVCATALAMWFALYPVLGRRTRIVALALGGAWTLAISLAVVGAHWHTPVDALGSILLSVGIVAGGAVAFEGAHARWMARR